MSIQDVTSLLDPELRPAFAAIPVGPPFGSDFPGRRAIGRKVMQQIKAALPPVEGIQMRDLTIPSRHGGPQIPLRIIAPKAGGNDAVLLWMHGGGYCVGHHEDEDLITAPWVRDAGCTVVSVGYRLAPEDPYPAGLNDCRDALDWIASAPAELGTTPKRIAVGGASAGAGLAAALSLRVRDDGGPIICYQLLLIPCADNRSITSSMQMLQDPRAWNLTANQAAWNAYAGGAGEVSPYAAPVHAKDLSGLPPAFVEVAGVDPLRDEGIGYASRLMQSGVDVELHVYPGAYHGSTYFQPRAAISVRAQQETARAVKRVLG